ncbi:hypothetical protein GCM10007860_04080 [Chitiniphilus shinanonensis]|uniref:Zorya protein ZorC EH domain-containing protein n=1 Tax=Chitiniphilus shinanonensis TaxID=553088 RepID=A0ABQ6BMM9_9NEIS|nr:hypothetical protein [Chitiniphilus shinanonensis]GLS03265.1 hypothetical protein GCM10007860_04080 [Chitiniphilus shinanonensis]
MREFITSLLSREKSPLSSPKVAVAWCRRIETLDPQTQLDKVGEAVAKYLEHPAKPDFESLQALVLVDNMVQPAFEAIRFQYVSNPRMAKDMEQRLWRDIVGFSQHMIESYQRFIEHEGDEVYRTAGFSEHMPLVLARSLHYIALEAKWHYFRFEKVPGKLWTLAHRFYRLSEIEGFDSNPFALYPVRDKVVSSCADEYIQLLMLATLSANNLSVRQLDWVDQWLDNWSKLVQINRRHQEDRDHFCVNLQEPQGPQKIQPESTGEPYRYWGLFDLLHEVQEVIKRLESGVAPADLGLGSDCRAPSCLELLKHLDTFWTMSIRNAQIQRSERYDVKKAADVVHGLDVICQQVRADNEKHSRQPTETRTQVDYDELMDMRLYGFVSARTRSKLQQTPTGTIGAPRVEYQSWLIENESKGGFGAVLRYSENDWVRPGRLLGVRLGDGQNWQVGVVRRLARRGNDEIYTGIQVLSATPVAVSIQQANGGARNEPMVVTELSDLGAELPAQKLALYLPYRGQDGGNMNTLILYGADYASDRLYRVQARDRSFTVSLGSVLEKGVDWIWVALQVIK